MKAMTRVMYIKLGDGTVNSDLFVASALHVKVADMHDIMPDFAYTIAICRVCFNVPHGKGIKYYNITLSIIT